MGLSLRTTAYVVVACSALVLPASAAAQSGGAVFPTPTPTPVSTPTPAPASARVVMASPMPSSPATVAKLACASSCGAAGMVRPGSLLRVRGKTLSKADEVVFMGAAGVEDDVIAETSVRRKTSVDVRVPLGAVPGPVAVVDQRRVSAPSVGPGRAGPGRRSPRPPSVEIAVRAPRAYYDAATPAAADVRGARRRRR